MTKTDFRIKLHYLLVVVVVSDVKVMSSTVAVIFAITWVVNNYNIQTEPRFWNQTELNPNRIFFKNRTEIKNPFRTSLLLSISETALIVSCLVHS